ncbi:MAG: hypothetical protein II007_13595 [Gammaproteobacteria bacterium]|nr:hypothetical protein [Gammaproteobacteria bacterium]
MTTNVTDFITDLDGGVFAEKLSKVLSDVAGSVIDSNKRGEVIIKLTFRQIGSGSQVGIGTKLSFVRPTRRGKYTEEDTTETPMHVGRGGKVTILPEDQGQLFDKRGDAPAVSPLRSAN